MRIDGMDASNRGQNVPNTPTDSRTIATETSVVASATGLSSVSTGAKDASPKLEQEQELNTISDKAVFDAIEKANRAIVGANREFSFSIHEKTNRIMVKIIDSETKEIIREIPPEKILDMVAQMWEMAGILIDERR